ncbi:hypothetical protein BZA70DRAFT_288058 [Myxozyma melibiosi]|uniref:Uncharacterized protein n=1 Tax=Myxozyma melibiosi TaxID=54550 RepID=A0ABR1FC08_9ASCO
MGCFVSLFYDVIVVTVAGQLYRGAGKTDRDDRRRQHWLSLACLVFALMSLAMRIEVVDAGGGSEGARSIDIKFLHARVTAKNEKVLVEKDSCV